jgi:hypothetical protein
MNEALKAKILDRLGRMVREVWIEWAREQPNPKPSWLLSWEEIEESDREVDRRIGLRLYDRGFQDAANLRDEAHE